MGQKDLPLASGEEHARAFERRGWRRSRRKKGTHIILEKEGVEATLSIPRHNEVKRRLIQKQVQVAGLTESDYLDAFRGR
jgi:predicted RNA binding protein YcfA (HicA-like mRNA interferase family)